MRVRTAGTFRGGAGPGRGHEGAFRTVRVLFLDLGAGYVGVFLL